jgi:Na/Pi-cotransporter
MEEQILKIIGGVGLFIYSLRIVTSAFDNMGSESTRKLIDRVTARSHLCVFSGVLITLIFQASSTTILITMGLLNRSLLTIEQATLIMLGAAVGTTLKVWFHWDLSLLIGAGLIFVSTIGFLLKWRQSRHRILEVTLGLGLTILGLELMTSGLAPILESPTLVHWLSSCRGASFTEASLAILTGCLAATLVQSSSSIIMLVVALATKGMISFEGASAIILGANIGTTSTALLLSIGQTVSAQRLAFMHFAAKSIGVIITLLFFKSFLSLIVLISPGVQSLDVSPFKLALVHTGFNLINLFFWWTFLPLLLKIGRAVLADKFDSEYWLASLGVQKLLERLPERAIQEAQTELQESVRGFNEVTEICLRLLTDGTMEESEREELFGPIPVTLDTLDKRLKSLETVMGRVAARWGDTLHLQVRLFSILERIYKLNRIASVLGDLVRVSDLDEMRPVLNNHELRTSILALAGLVKNLWDEFYRSLPEDMAENASPQSVVDGAVLFEMFLKGQDFRTGIKVQRIYSALFSLYKELQAGSESSLLVEKQDFGFDVKRSFTLTFRAGLGVPPMMPKPTPETEEKILE